MPAARARAGTTRTGDVTADGLNAVNNAGDTVHRNASFKLVDVAQLDACAVALTVTPKAGVVLMLAGPKMLTWGTVNANFVMVTLAGADVTPNALVTVTLNVYVVPGVMVIEGMINEPRVDKDTILFNKPPVAAQS